MHRLNSTQIICLIGTVVLLPLIASIPCIAQAESGTLSGVVLDTERKPIAGFSINLSPVFKVLKTDENGAFTFTDVPAGPVQIMIPPQQFEENGKPTFNLEPDDEVVSIKIGGITIYQDIRPPFGGIRFAVKSGSHLKNIEVTVRPRMRIRARVVFKDRKPLTNASISTVIIGDGTRSGGGTTDSEGYFVHYLDHDDEEASYKVSVKHKGLSAESDPFALGENGRYDDLVLTLDGNAPARCRVDTTRSTAGLAAQPSPQTDGDPDTYPRRPSRTNSAAATPC